MKINILGAEYEYMQRRREEDETLSDADGYCNAYSKKIIVVSDEGHAREDSDTDESMKAVMGKIKRHEIVHAFFAESGLRGYFENEQLVDWVAWHFPAMLKAMREVGAI